MVGEPEQRDLFPEVETPKSTVVVNERCLVRTSDGHCVVVVYGVVLAQYAISDRMAEVYAMVGLVQQGWADQNDIARAFGRLARTLWRYEQRFETGGLAAQRQGATPRCVDSLGMV